VRGRDDEYLKDTLMDGELVVDNDQNSNTKVRQSIFLLIGEGILMISYGRNLYGF
jgi:hypothetical protein